MGIKTNLAYKLRGVFRESVGWTDFLTRVVEEIPFETFENLLTAYGSKHQYKGSHLLSCGIATQVNESVFKVKLDIGTVDLIVEGGFISDVDGTVAGTKVVGPFYLCTQDIQNVVITLDTQKTALDHQSVAALLNSYETNSTGDLMFEKTVGRSSVYGLFSILKQLGIVPIVEYHYTNDNNTMYGTNVATRSNAANLSTVNGALYARTWIDIDPLKDTIRQGVYSVKVLGYDRGIITLEEAPDIQIAHINIGEDVLELTNEDKFIMTNSTKMVGYVDVIRNSYPVTQSDNDLSSEITIRVDETAVDLVNRVLDNCIPARCTKNVSPYTMYFVDNMTISDQYERRIKIVATRTGRVIVKDGVIIYKEEFEKV